MSLPKDPVILLSVINTKLRDQYGSLEELCEDMQVEKEELIRILGGINYTYDEENRQFR